MDTKPRVRFAPSPTGHLHIGGARTAIFNWLLARHVDGTFLVRVEDTDVERSKKEYVDSILESLEWLGLMPDEPLVYQLSRLEEHKKAVKQLLDAGKAYPCFCEPRDTEETLQNLEKGIATKYDGTCRDKAWTEEDLKRPHAIRFKLPQDKESVSFPDLIRGEITFPMDQLDDFVIVRRDGTPTYNFCVVVDDIFMKITHIIRGEDHISNTPKQILIYEALGEKVPAFGHLPLILGESGGKLSKRDAAVSVVEYKKNGFLADALFNYLVRLGWAHGDQEVFSKEEMVEFFTLDKVGKKGGVFDTKKLLWLNGIYIRNLTLEAFQKALGEVNNDKLKELTGAWNTDSLGQLFEVYKDRATSIVQLADDIISLSKVPEVYDLSLIKKWLSPVTKGLLQDFVKQVETMEDYNNAGLLSLARSTCEKHEVKLVSLAQPLRLAITGTTSSPGVFELLELLGKEEALQRIAQLIKQLD